MTVLLDMDPAADLEPIRGVDLRTYARLSAQMLRLGVTQPDAIERFAEENGVGAGEWEFIQAGWIERLRRSEELRVRYRAEAMQIDPDSGDRPTDGTGGPDST